METKSTPNFDDPISPQVSNNKSARLPTVILTCPVNIISFQQDVKPIEQDQFLLRTTPPGIRIATHFMADYKAISSYLSEYGPHHFTFYPQYDKLTKGVIRRLPLITGYNSCPLGIGLLCYTLEANGDQTPLT
jgi:hypothetical protein